jgi:short-subunit dehydrogenase
MESATFEDWDWVFGVNVGGVINCLNAFLPRMIERGAGGHVVTVGSMAGFLPGSEAGVYSASKCAARGITESLHYSLAKHGIGVSLVSPGLVDSNIHEAFLGRPPVLGLTGMPPAAEMKEAVKDMLRLGLSPDVIGRIAVDGVKANKLYIFTHPEFADDLAELHQEIMGALPAGHAPLQRLEVEEGRRQSLRAARAKAREIGDARLQRSRPSPVLALLSRSMMAWPRSS